MIPWCFSFVLPCNVSFFLLLKSFGFVIFLRCDGPLPSSTPTAPHRHHYHQATVNMLKGRENYKMQIEAIPHTKAAPRMWKIPKVKTMSDSTKQSPTKGS